METRQITLEELYDFLKSKFAQIDQRFDLNDKRFELIDRRLENLERMVRKFTTHVTN